MSCQQGLTPLISKMFLIVCKLIRNDPTFHLSYYLSKQFAIEYGISIPSFKYSSIKLIMFSFKLWSRLE